LAKKILGTHFSKNHTERVSNQYSPEMVKPFINLYHINLYRHNSNGYESAHEQNTVKKGILE